MMDDLFAAFPPPALAVSADDLYGPPETSLVWKVRNAAGDAHYFIKRRSMLAAADVGPGRSLLTLSFTDQPLLVTVDARRFSTEMPGMKVTGIPKEGRI